ncbi:Uncharacterised protein [Mycobacterium tuberculosis]|nr:Uncharacterised protein [Mycobacterium tuberculosis]
MEHSLFNNFNLCFFLRNFLNFCEGRINIFRQIKIFQSFFYNFFDFRFFFFSE